MSTVTTPAGRRERRSVDSAVAGEAIRSQSRRVAATYGLVLLLLSLFAWAPLLYPGYVQVHSGFLPLFNLANLAESHNKLTWLPSVGVSPDLLRGEGPLAYWLALLMRPLLGNVGAIKAVFALSVTAGGLGMAAWVRRSFASTTLEADITERAALLAAAVYMLWPALLAMVYVRGALAEAVVMGLLPWALLAVSSARRQVSGGKWQVAGKEAEGGRRNEVPERSGVEEERGTSGAAWAWMVGVAALVAALVWTQAGLALWATLLLLVWAVWPGADRRGRIASAVAVLVGAAAGFGLFWLLHRGLGAGGAAPDFAAHAVYPYQLFSPAWGFGISTPDWKNELPLQLGLAATGLAMLAAVLGLGKSANQQISKSADQQISRSANQQISRTDGQQTSISEDEQPETSDSEFIIHHSSIVDSSFLLPPTSFLLRFALILSLVLILLATTLTRPLWQLAPALARPLSYPWQLLLLTGPLLALLAGSVVVLERRLAEMPAWAAIVAFVVLASYPYLAPHFTQVDPGDAPVGIFGANQVTLLTAGDSTPSLTLPLGGGGNQTPSPSEGDCEARGGGESLAITEPFTVTATWQAIQPVDFDYSVFVHALDAAGNTVAQWDGQPQRDGQPYPMTAWQVGEIVADAYRLEASPEQRAAIRSVELGLYNWQTGQRLTVDRGDKVTLPAPPVESGAAAP